MKNVFTAGGILAFSLFMCLRLRAQDDSLSSPPGFGFSFQWNNYAQQAQFIDDFYYRSVWSAEANAKRTIDASRSCGASFDYFIKDEIFIRAGGFWGYQKCSARIDSTNNYDPWGRNFTNDWRSARKRGGLTFACGAEKEYKGFTIYAGAGALCLWDNGFYTFHESRESEIDLAGGTFYSTYHYTSQTQLKRSVCYGPGSFAGCRLKLFGGLSCGLEFSMSYLFTDRKSTRLNSSHIPLS